MYKTYYILQAIWFYFIFTIFRKVFGRVWFFVVFPFKGYADNVVFNYVLSNGIDLPRLLERPIKEFEKHYIIEPYHGTKDGGFMWKRKVSWLEYQLVYWIIWGWLDADANYGFYDEGQLKKEILVSWYPDFVTKRLQYALDNLPEYGNTFDLGDNRNTDLKFYFWASFLWNNRNTGYNFNYMQFDSSIQHFYIDYKYFQFGYKWTWPVEGSDYDSYRLTFGFKKLEHGQA